MLIFVVCRGWHGEIVISCQKYYGNLCAVLRLGSHYMPYGVRAYCVCAVQVHLVVGSFRFV